MDPLYLGRIVAAAKMPDGRPAALYRVSSRSFPNRTAAIADNGASAAIVPRPGHEEDNRKNPYVAYRCARLVGSWALLTNGSHTDPAADMIERGVPVKEALVQSLAVLDYEKDGFGTPRIAVATALDGEDAWLGVVRPDGLEVRRFQLRRGECLHLSTNEHSTLEDCHGAGAGDPGRRRHADFAARTADEALAYVLGGGAFAHYVNPVCAVVATVENGVFRLAARDADPDAASADAARFDSIDDIDPIARTGYTPVP